MATQSSDTQKKKRTKVNDWSMRASKEDLEKLRKDAYDKSVSESPNADRIRKKAGPTQEAAQKAEKRADDTKTQPAPSRPATEASGGVSGTSTTKSKLAGKARTGFSEAGETPLTRGKQYADKKPAPTPGGNSLAKPNSNDNLKESMKIGDRRRRRTGSRFQSH